MTLESGRAQHTDEVIRVALDSQLEDAPSWSLQTVNRSRGRDGTLVHDDDVIAGVFDVGQQVR